LRGDFAGNHRFINVAKPFLRVTDVTFAFQDSENGADGGVIRRIVELLLNLLAGSTAGRKKYVHNPALAAAEGGLRRALRHV